MKRIITVGALAVSTCILLTGCHVKHEWQEATCTEPKTCLVGGETKGEALGHTWVEATCTEPRTCSVCGETEGEALGHNWQEATCTEAKTCSICGEIEGEALGHNWQKATCQMPKTCSVCGETEGGVTDHKWQEATCTTPKNCSMCGEMEGEALGHEWVEATCTEPKTCSVCGETEGKPLGHEASDDGNCIRCGEYAKDGVAWSYEDVEGYGILTIWGNGPVSTKTMVEAGFDSDLMRNIDKIIIKGNIKGISSIGIPKDITKDESLPLESIVIEDSVTGNIRIRAFMRNNTHTYSNLKQVYIGNGIEEIEHAAFYMCRNLESVYIGENCRRIESMAFASARNLYVELPKECHYASNAFLYDVEKNGLIKY